MDGEGFDLLEDSVLGDVHALERPAGLPLPERQQLVVRQRVGRRPDVQRLVLGARVAGGEHGVGRDVRLVHEHPLATPSPRTTALSTGGTWASTGPTPCSP